MIYFWFSKVTRFLENEEFKEVRPLILLWMLFGLLIALCCGINIPVSLIAVVTRSVTCNNKMTICGSVGCRESDIYLQGIISGLSVATHAGQGVTLFTGRAIDQGSKLKRKRHAGH